MCFCSTWVSGNHQCIVSINQIIQLLETLSRQKGVRKKKKQIIHKRTTQATQNLSSHFAHLLGTRHAANISFGTSMAVEILVPHPVCSPAIFTKHFQHMKLEMIGCCRQNGDPATQVGHPLSQILTAENIRGLRTHL